MYRAARIIPLFVVATLLVSEPAWAAVVEVDVTIKSVDVKARGITVVYETTLGQKNIDLDVSRKAEITLNGNDGTLDSLRPGQKAKVVFEKELQVVTRIIATGSGKAIREKRPELVECSELNDMGGNDHPWLSEDGLTIYWDRAVDGKTSIWTARRENPQSMFTDKKALFAGWCPTLSADGLEMVFVARRADGQQGRSLYATSRATATGGFRRPSEIAELAGFSSWGPSLSADGLTLYFGQGSMVVCSTRPERSSPWTSPKTFASVAVGCPSVTPDGKYLFGHDDAAFKQPSVEHGNLLICSRPTAQGTFNRPSPIQIDGSSVLFGGCPRYVASTKELVFARLVVRDGRWERKPPTLWIIKNFNLPGADE